MIRIWWYKKVNVNFVISFSQKFKIFLRLLGESAVVTKLVNHGRSTGTFIIFFSLITLGSNRKQHTWSPSSSGVRSMTGAGECECIFPCSCMAVAGNWSASFEINRSLLSASLLNIQVNETFECSPSTRGLRYWCSIVVSDKSHGPSVNSMWLTKNDNSMWFVPKVTMFRAA